jgi:hypothetical protein
VTVAGTVLSVMVLTRPGPAVPEVDAGAIENGDVGLLEAAVVDVVPPPGGLVPPDGCVGGVVVCVFGGSAV